VIHALHSCFAFMQSRSQGLGEACIQIAGKALGLSKLHRPRRPLLIELLFMLENFPFMQKSKQAFISSSVGKNIDARMNEWPKFVGEEIFLRTNSLGQGNFLPYTRSSKFSFCFAFFF